MLQRAIPKSHRVVGVGTDVVDIPSRPSFQARSSFPVEGTLTLQFAMLDQIETFGLPPSLFAIVF